MRVAKSICAGDTVDMNKTYAIGALALVVAIGGMWYVTHPEGMSESGAPAAHTAPTDLGTYSYECDEHVAFMMTPAADMHSIMIVATQGAYPPATRLMQKQVASGVRYEGGGIVFTGKGETVTLGRGDSAINCSPVPSQTAAPFNFGN